MGSPTSVYSRTKDMSNLGGGDIFVLQSRRRPVRHSTGNYGDRQPLPVQLSRAPRAENVPENGQAARMRDTDEKQPMLSVAAFQVRNSGRSRLRGKTCEQRRPKKVRSLQINLLLVIVQSYQFEQCWHRERFISRINLNSAGTERDSSVRSI